MDAKIFLNFKKENKKFIQIGSVYRIWKIKSPQKENINKQKIFSIYGNAKLIVLIIYYLL